MLSLPTGRLAVHQDLPPMEVHTGRTTTDVRTARGKRCRGKLRVFVKDNRRDGKDRPQIWLTVLVFEQCQPKVDWSSPCLEAIQRGLRQDRHTRH